MVRGALAGVAGRQFLVPERTSHARVLFVTAPFGVAIIGYGLAGRIFHAPLVASVDGLKLRAIVSRRSREILADHPGVTPCASPDGVLRDPAVDLVVVATPNATHFELAARALAAGKHVVVDKPFTATAVQARELADRAESAGRMLSVFHNRRWDSDFRTLQRLMGDGTLGDITYFESRFDRFRPAVTDRWRERAGPASGTWYDLGSHLIDQALLLFGRPSAVFADLAAQRPGAVTTDYFHVLLRYQQRRVVLAGSSLAPWSSLRLVAQGTLGSYVKHGFDPQEAFLRNGGKPGDAGFCHDPRPGVLVGPDGRETSPAAEKCDYRGYYEALRDALAGRAAVPVPATDGIAVMDILEAAESSAAAHAEFLLP
ncbi:MAG: oxidoreductase [Alphaproteobacteria bacterium]|nr:oxidoreductase [Alphaproteobacteria bacterium]